MKKKIFIALHSLFSLICIFYMYFIIRCGCEYTWFVFDFVKNFPESQKLFWHEIDFMFIHEKLNMSGYIYYYWYAMTFPLLCMLIICVGGWILLYKNLQLTESEKKEIRIRRQIIKAEKIERRKKKAMNKTHILEEKLKNMKSDE